MLQRCTNPVGGTVTAADTTAHALPAVAALFVLFSAPAANTGVITVSDTAGIAGGNLTGGVPILKGAAPIQVGPILHLEALAYQAATAGDVLNYLVVG